jgi:hypothetical protein
MTCETCIFRAGDECRKSPPVRLPRKFSGSATSGNRVRDEALLWGWPKIERTDWCGEFVGTADAGETSKRQVSAFDPVDEEFES